MTQDRHCGPVVANGRCGATERLRSPAPEWDGNKALLGLGDVGAIELKEGRATAGRDRGEGGFLSPRGPAFHFCGPTERCCAGELIVRAQESARDAQDTRTFRLTIFSLLRMFKRQATACPAWCVFYAPTAQLRLWANEPKSGVCSSTRVRPAWVGHLHCRRHCGSGARPS
jgi:hypothetical protein